MMPERAPPLQQALDELSALLVEERAVLLEGSPARLSAIADAKSRLAQYIEALTSEPDQPPPDQDTLLRLDRYNRENAIICDTMLRHFMAALDSLRLHDPHRSYTVSGGEQRASPVNFPLGTA
jgi:hypothetical protein